MGDVLSNVIGAPFSPYITSQLKLRANLGSTKNRTDEQVLFLANKMSWTRLSSFVRIKPAPQQDGTIQTISQFYNNLFNFEIPPGDYSKGESLAKNWTLQSGTSEYNNGSYDLRFGLGPDGAYGLGGINQQGYRPMPGLTSVTVDTKGTLGSLREATINFSVWNMTQLNVIEALYFRLGYTMLLEWGHVNYFTNPTIVNPNGQFVTRPSGLDVFKYDSKEQILQAVTQRNKETDGNYDAMLGTVTNFFFSFNSQGGYDCNIRLIGLGSIIETLRLNQTFTMPNSLREQVQQAEKSAELKKAEQLRLKDQENRKSQGLPATIPEVPKDIQGIKSIINTDLGTTTVSDSQIKNITYPTITDPNNLNVNSAFDYFYKAAQGGKSTNAAYVRELNSTRTGLFLNPISGIRPNFQILNVENPQSITLSGGLLTLGAVRALNAEDIEDPWTSGQYENADLSNALGSDTIAKLFDLTIRDSRGLTLESKVNNLFSREVAPNDPIGQIPTPKGTNIVTQFFSSLIGVNEVVGIPLAYSYTGLVKNPFNGATIKKRFYVVFTYDPPPINAPTRQELTTAFQNWFTNSRRVNVTSITQVGALTDSRIVIDGTLADLNVPNKPTPIINIKFDNTALIQTVLPTSSQDAPTPQLGSTVDSQGNTVGQGNQTNATQTEQKEKFNSALHTMLNTVKTIGQTKGDGAADAVVPINLVEITREFYNSGILQGVISTSLDKLQQEELARGNFNSPLLGGVDFELTSYAKKGFNSNLMADKTNFAKVPDIKWDELCTAYYVGYEFSDNGATNTTGAEKPVYIKLGYLLAFLNNMCLLYESTGKKSNGEENTQNTLKPYTYIDFHPDFNFCLTAPQHMTIDPTKCFIPLVCTDLEYEDLFNVNVKVAFDTPIFKPATSSRLSTLKTFKTSNAYQGKTMEILLSTQFLLDLADRFISSDKDSALNLKPFLDTLLSEISRSTGNFNLFRVAYRDDSNTIIIKDDQWTPNYEGETSAVEKQSYLNNRQYMELQVFGSGSLVRDMEFRTNMNTKMSTMIAISAQSGGKLSANGVDASPIAIYNVNYEDHIMQIKRDVNVNSAKETEEERRLKIIDTNNAAAIKFNSYVESVYYGGRIPISQTNSAAKYYQDRLTELKSRDIATTAAPFIPANLSITLDGISGIVMGNAFGIPESRLPASLRGDKGDFTKVGFVVVGLTHTLENNQWLTKIRGQMINLRQKTFAQTADSNSNINAFNYPTTSGPIGRCRQLGCVRRNSNAYTAAPLYQNTQFRAGIDTLTKKYQLKDSTALYKVIYAESRLDPNAVLKSTNATGLLQFLPDSAINIGTTVDIIRRTDGVGQLKFIEKYFDQYPAIKGGGVYEIYAAVFFPALLKHLNDPNWIIETSKLKAYTVSVQNPAIACSAGKQPGEALTVSDFKKYVDCIS